MADEEASQPDGSKGNPRTERTREHCVALFEKRSDDESVQPHYDAHEPQACSQRRRVRKTVEEAPCEQCEDNRRYERVDYQCILKRQQLTPECDGTATGHPSDDGVPDEDRTLVSTRGTELAGHGQNSRPNW